MILRRIAQGIKDQDWFVVSVEIMIVVIGIFIGLQVDDWNNDRKDDIREQEVLLALWNESGDRLEYLEDQINSYHMFIKQQEASIQALVAGALPETLTHDDFVKGVTLTRRLGPPNPPSAIYDSIVATGEIRLLENQTIVQILAKFQVQKEIAQEYASRLHDNAEIRKAYHPAIISEYDPSARFKRKMTTRFEDVVGDAEFLENSVDVLRAVMALQNNRHALMETAKEIDQLLCLEAGVPCRTF